MSSADNFCKQFGPNLFDTQIVALTEFFEKLDDFEKNRKTKKNKKKVPGGKELKNLLT